MGPLHKQKWDGPLASVGDYRGTIKIKSAGMFQEKRCCWEARDGSPASTALKQLLPKINELFQASGNRVPDSAMVLMDIFMIGESAEESVPYIMFSCPNTCKRARIEAMNLVRRSGLLKEFPGVKVYHWEFPPHIPDPELTIGASSRLKSSSHDEHDDSDESSRGTKEDRIALEIHLSATYNGKVDACAGSQKSTIGAIIRFGQCVLYFTAAHMLLSGCDATNQQAPQEGDTDDFDDCDSEYFSEDDSAYGSEELSESIESPSMSPQRPLSTAQDTPMHGHYPSCRNPSLNNETEQSRHPTQNNRTSAIPQSSTAPNITNREIFFKSHELDFALLDLSDFEVPPCDIPKLNYDTISPIGPGSTQVVAFTGSRGNLRGQMSGRSSYIRFPHGRIYQEVYPIFFSTAVKVGDSGTIVRDANTGAIYGHIVVASIESRTAFIVPATQVLQTIPWLTTTDPRIYRRLDYNAGQIRLVRLLPPSTSGNGIRCELSLAWLRDRPFYEALSYVWGHEAESTPILLNGRPWNVRPVLAAALRRLRCQDKERHIWVDALCIDQSNGSEKSSQTRHMKDVFGGCTMCLIWLGDVYDEPSSSSERAFSLTYPPMNQPSQPSSTVSISWQDAHLSFELIAQFGNMKADEIPLRVHFSGFSLTSQRALGRLMGLPCWKRFWPFQSSIFARSSTLICGSMGLDLGLFGRSAFTLRKCLRQRAWRRRSDGMDFDILIPFMHTAGRIHRFRNCEVLDAFAFILNSMRDLTCAGYEAKALAFVDRFYSVETANEIKGSSPRERISKAIATHQILSTNSVLPLARTTETGRNNSLPSWVPDWSAYIESEPRFYSELSFLMSWKLFNASSGKESIIDINDDTLQVQGVLVDFVSTTYKLMGPGDDEPVLGVKLAPYLGGVSTNKLPKLSGHGMLSHKMRAAPFQSGRTQVLPSPEFWPLLTSDIRIAEHDEMEWRRARESDREACLREYQHGLLGHGVRGRRLFSTKMSHFGLGPPEMKVGDVVVVIYGGRFPFILRPIANRKYNLVGYAYVLGIMDGEAVSGAQETQTFQIV